MEGAKAYILPAVAAAVVLLYFVFRPAVQTETGVSQTAQGSSISMRIDAAVREHIGPPGLGDAYVGVVRDALAQAAKPCSNKVPPGTKLEIEVRVNAASDLGGHFTSVEIEAEPADGAEGATMCIREALGALVLPAPPQTSTGTLVVEL